MKTGTIIINVLLMAVFGCVCAIVMGLLHNRAVEYPSEPFLSQPLPPLSDFLLKNMWITWAMPAAWAIMSIWMILKKKVTAEHQALHISATLLVGLTMLFIFAMAGIFPFVGFIAHLQK